MEAIPDVTQTQQSPDLYGYDQKPATATVTQTEMTLGTTVNPHHTTVQVPGGPEEYPSSTVYAPVATAAPPGTVEAQINGHGGALPVGQDPYEAVFLCPLRHHRANHHP